MSESLAHTYVKHRGTAIGRTFAAIAAELDQALFVFQPLASPHEALAVIREEYVELEREVFRSRARPTRLVAEAVQLAAMAARLVLELGEPQVTIDRVTYRVSHALTYDGRQHGKD